MPTGDKKYREMKKLRVSAVALVDDPANRRRWAIIKSQQSRAAAKGKEAMKAKDKKTAGAPAQDEKVKKEDGHRVVSEDSVQEWGASVTAAKEALDSFEESLGGLNYDANGLAILSQETMEKWQAVGDAVAAISSAMGGGAPAPMAPVEPPAEEAAKDKPAGDPTAKAVEARIKGIEESVELIKEAVVALAQLGVAKSKAEAEEGEGEGEEEGDEDEKGEEDSEASQLYG